MLSSAEYLEESGEIEQFEQLQGLINSGIAWRLDGAIGRSAMNAIDGGYCMLGREAHNDAYGNSVLSRKEVKRFTKGSKSFVEKCYGKDYANRLAKIK
jgi:lysozyme family protein